MASETLQKLKGLIVDNKKREIEKLFATEYKDNKKVLLNSKLEGKTLLCYAFGKNHLKIAEYLLENGANVNGITNEGLTDAVPVAYAIGSNLKVNDIIKVFNLAFLYGLDINFYGNNLLTPLVVAIISTLQNVKTKGLNYLDYTLIEYLLSKGANPNVKISQPLFALIELVDKYALYDPKILKLVDILIYYNANPYLVNSKGYTLSNYISFTNIPKNFQKDLNSHLFINMDDILKDCDNPLYIKKLANAFKIPFKESELTNKDKRKQICECITFFKENFSLLTDEDFEHFIDLRSEKNNLNCENISTLEMVDLNEFNKNDLYTIKIGKNKQHCFTRNELIYLLKEKKNPWDGTSLSEDQLKDIFIYFKTEPYTNTGLQDAIEIFKKESIIDFTLDDLLDVITHICKPVNPYPSYGDLKKINNDTLFYLFDDLLMTNLKGVLNFTMLKGLKLESNEYTKIKLYELFYTILNYIVYRGPQPENLDPFKLSYILNKALTLDTLKDKIVGMLLEKYNIDMTREENDRIFRSNLHFENQRFIDLDGFEILATPQMFEDINELIVSLGENIEVFNREDAINLWNGKLRFLLRYF